MNVNWLWWKKRLLTPEVIIFVIVFVLAVYLYFKYDRHAIRIYHDEIDYEQLFLPLRNSIPTIRVPHGGKRHKHPKQNKSENKCRYIFEKIFNRKFPSIRPDFLKNPTTGHNLELDGYCESLKLAFEYDGEQHARYNTHFHKNTKDFVYQVAKDDFKTKKCETLGITLIRIPHYIHPSSLEDYIKREIGKISKFKSYVQ
jgi:hypothetical protein